MHLIHRIRCMHGIRPHDWHEHAYQFTSGRCHHSLLATRSAEQNLGLASIQVQLGETQSEDVACGDVLIRPSLVLRCAGYQADARRGRSYGSDECTSTGAQQPPDQPDHPMPDPRPPTPLDERMSDPPPSRSGFRLAIQAAANKGWNVFHMDLKTAFLQGCHYLSDPS